MRADQDLLGESIEYPGHPITLAFIIASLYPSLKSALDYQGRDYPAALRDSRIPGSGGNVWGALDFLRHSHNSWEFAVSFADDFWARCDNQKQNDQPRWRRGQEQADRIKDRLKEKLGAFDAR